MRIHRSQVQAPFCRTLCSQRRFARKFVFGTDASNAGWMNFKGFTSLSQVRFYSYATIFIIFFRLPFVVMTPIRVRSGNPNHELNDLPCFDRWFTARANKPTNSRGGPRSRAKALSNLIHLFRASGCPSSGL